MPILDRPPVIVEQNTTAAPKLPEQWKVILHNDPVNEGHYVAKCLEQVVGLAAQKAWDIMMAAHREGRALVIVKPLEIAEHYQAQLQAKNLTISLEKE